MAFSSQSLQATLVKKCPEDASEAAECVLNTLLFKQLGYSSYVTFQL
jgi:hypothetical protein